MASRGRGSSLRKDGFDYNFRIVLVGDQGVGKSTLIRRYVQGIYQPGMKPDDSVDTYYKDIEKLDKKVRLEIRDTAGLERYRSLTSSYYRGAHGCILMFDVTNQQSFDTIANWYKDVKEYSPDSICAVLVGSKCHEERVISSDSGHRRADDLEIAYREISSEKDLHIDSLFNYLIDAMIKNFKANEKNSAFVASDVQVKKVRYCSC